MHLASSGLLVLVRYEAACRRWCFPQGAQLITKGAFHHVLASPEVLLRWYKLRERRCLGSEVEFID